MNGFFSGISEQWLESLYRDWRDSPDSVSLEWQTFFAGFELGLSHLNPAQHEPCTKGMKLSGVHSLISRYRSLGYLQACTDPLSPCQLSHAVLERSAFGLAEKDLDEIFHCADYYRHDIPLREIIDALKATYCHEIGVEFMHIQNPVERDWLIEQMEPCRNRPELTIDQRLGILSRLHEANHFEQFLHRRFIGQKRFSLEGGETLIPLLDRIVSTAPSFGITDLILGMPHRGRLNVLAHILRKPYENIFGEFTETIPTGFAGDGDVKYHKGHSVDIESGGRKLHVTIAANPSHLEAVNAVVEGKSRARQDRYGFEGKSRVLPLLIHGDSAFAGQGSVMEVLNLSRLEGYATGGTLHIVLNNQIGFTTLPEESRSTPHSTDIARMLSCPIFHIQGEAPEAAIHAIDIAMNYRRKFGKDVVIDLVCYRRHGHNEGDEPAFTQPDTYRRISSRPAINRIYADFLKEEHGVAVETLEGIESAVRTALEVASSHSPSEKTVGYSDRWSGMSPAYEDSPVATAVSEEMLLDLSRLLTSVPEGFTLHPKIETLLRKRHEAVILGEGIDWGNAELLAYATLLQQGYKVRLSGQDSQRGTFNHRHSVVVDNLSEQKFMPLERIAPNKEDCQIWNSSLSEFAVLGFEYGFSLETPECLTLWEAQFGDFANGAQVVIDQFIASGETKWNRGSGLVMLLPHGYEGQGAEHSSARMERYLQLCANNNMIVACPSTPAQMFHLLRRQLLQKFRKPLIVFTPKSLLRNSSCVSGRIELSHGGFERIIAHAEGTHAAKAVLFCSGKIFYELESSCLQNQLSGIAIVRIEQLYPLDEAALLSLIESCPLDCFFRWVQEEPMNMGGWAHIEKYFRKIGTPLEYFGREEDACPASASHALHVIQQAEITSRALSL